MVRGFASPLIGCLLIVGLVQSARAAWLDPMSFPTIGGLNLQSGSYSIDTSGTQPALRDAFGETLFTGSVQSTQRGSIAVFNFDSIAVGHTVTITATGERPLAVLSQLGITIAGTFIASGQNGSAAGAGGLGGPGGGVGGDGSSGTGRGQNGQGPGAGMGGVDGVGNRSWGSGAGFGGRGGDGSQAFDPPRLSATYGNLALALEGGSGGGGSGTTPANVVGSGGGGGGGAVEFGAAGSLIIAAEVRADGGLGGSANGILAGGGSGGGLLFHGSTITVSPAARISANGGGPFGGGGQIEFLTNSGRIGSFGPVLVEAGTGNGQQEAGSVTINSFSGVVIAIPGDVNQDDLVTVTDIDVLSEAIRNGRMDTVLDVDRSGTVDRADLSTLVNVIFNTTAGDANLDGMFNTTDLIRAFQAGEYEDQVLGNSTWAEGDWNGDGDFGTGDLLVAFQSGAFELGVRMALPVPEPIGVFGAMISLATILGRPRRQSRPPRS